MKFVLLALLAIHGLLHLLGFLKAFELAALKALSQPVNKVAGVFWLLATLLFLVTLLLYQQQVDAWVWLLLAAMLVSQVLIVSFWKDARFGTLANMALLLPFVMGIASLQFKNSYRTDVRYNLQHNNPLTEKQITENDLAALPLLVRQYLQYTGAVHQPRVSNMYLVFEGEMRSRERDWFPFRCEQYNFMEAPARLFFMEAQIRGLPVPGYHRYADGKASMDIRAGGLKRVAYESGAAMDKTETVTLFNDMCLMAPATLIDPRITWEPIDNKSVRARFTNQGITISAVLYFNAEGALIDFISNDRTDISSGSNYTFSTPVQNYQQLNGHKVPTYGEAVWHYPEGAFTYGKFRLKKVVYNVTRLQ